ncbi:unnamed protein product [Mycena citricolor]|uniref:RING-type domain-containing protein n=1 Tax=Mycena citricolor TaxID=2018698 RepID=A0AAD2HJC7_9AGAR|nr:unnamed protein product [Mycena citricolor]
MDTELKCNRLTCRRPLSDKAVVTTCSHIFCVECANELFNASRLCPACETVLSEPDDVVVCSLHPSNDYKTSVLSGLGPPVVLEICSRCRDIVLAVPNSSRDVFPSLPAMRTLTSLNAMDRSFQQAVVRSVNDKNAQLQKQLENVVREANGEISLLSNKNADYMVPEFQRDLELERRKVRDLQEAARERDKEYQKLKVLVAVESKSNSANTGMQAQHDKIKRKALLAPGAGPQMSPNEEQLKLKAFGDGGMVSQRTPLVTRSGASWGQGHQQQQGLQVPRSARRVQTHRQPFAAGDRVHASNQSYSNASDRSTSSNEVENMLLTSNAARASANHGWQTAPSVSRMKTVPRAVFAPPGAPVQQRMSGNFRAAGMQRSGNQKAQHAQHAEAEPGGTASGGVIMDGRLNIAWESGEIGAMDSPIVL